MSKTYVLCQTGDCQKTYPLEYFGEITKDTKDIDCPDCGGILIDQYGKANLSQNEAIITVLEKLPTLTIGNNSISLKKHNAHHPMNVSSTYGRMHVIDYEYFLKVALEKFNYRKFKVVWCDPTNVDQLIKFDKACKNVGLKLSLNRKFVNESH